jgi:4'-phosphopantetheinyl transferase EntD
VVDDGLDSDRGVFDGLFPLDVCSVSTGSGRAPPAPLPEEQRLVELAVAKRQREFAMGRACAHAALERLGIHGVPILSGARREPLWPDGVVGSISHTDGMCAAAVASASKYQGIGIDLEPDRPLPPEIASAVCSKEELVALERTLAFDPLLIARLVFSAKESVYKCQYPSTQAWLGFDDVQIRLAASGELSVQACRIAGQDDWPGRLRGRWKREAGFLVVAAWLTRET